MWESFLRIRQRYSIPSTVMRREPFLFSAIFASSAAELCCVAAVAKSRLHANVPNVVANKRLSGLRMG